jgi:hypothetical protein
MIGPEPMINTFFGLFIIVMLFLYVDIANSCQQSAFSKSLLISLSRKGENDVNFI